ncbi:MAG TPA: FAD-dependent oxidoreductase [Kofleriaceae bacterium]|nr:FAD-dependent oxidoreductase [Kofleriaceae bacterium]
MVDSVDVLVIGAGVSGLGFANWWRELEPGARIAVCEADSEPGGYCKTIVRDGFVWDYSGHFFHFKHPEIEQWLRARMPGQDVRTVERVSKIRFKGRDIDFPFQTHIHQLALDDFLECLVALFFRPKDEAPPHSFGEMLYRRLGAGITDKFLRPYNEKLYATNLDTLDVDAMGRFFPHADLHDIIGNMRPGGPKKHGYNATFTYPAGGAIQYIHALLQDLPAGTVSCGEPVTSIDLGARIATTPKRKIHYDRIVSSAPLRALAKICHVEHDASVFTSNQVLVFNLGFDKKGPSGIHWMYFPDPAISFYRVGWYDNILDGDRMSLYVEIGAPDGASIDVPGLRARVLADLVKEGIVTDHQLVAEHHVALDPAYVHITRASLAETARLRELLAAKHVHSVGRYGGWTYCSIEDNLVETRELACTLHAR